MFKLLLLRHGESTWNAQNLFTGWVDVDLSAVGEREAVRSGELLVEAGLLPEVVHTSLQRRAIRTAELTLARAERSWIPVRRSWRLNERHYGALQGQDKAQIRATYGEERFLAWRRSYDVPPPPMEPDQIRAQARDPRYAGLAPDVLPASECLKDVLARLLPYWYDAIVADLRAARTVLVVAHGNSVRALVKHLDSISDADITGVNIPTGIPLCYELDDQLCPTRTGGRYLDPAAAAEAIDAVARQGGGGGRTG